MLGTARRAETLWVLRTDVIERLVPGAELVNRHELRLVDGDRVLRGEGGLRPPDVSVRRPQTEPRADRHHEERCCNEQRWRRPRAPTLDNLRHLFPPFAAVAAHRLVTRALERRQGTWTGTREKPPTGGPYGT